MRPETSSARVALPNTLLQRHLVEAADSPIDRGFPKTATRQASKQLSLCRSQHLQHTWSTMYESKGYRKLPMHGSAGTQPCQCSASSTLEQTISNLRPGERFRPALAHNQPSLCPEDLTSLSAMYLHAASNQFNMLHKSYVMVATKSRVLSAIKEKIYKNLSVFSIE